MEIIVEAHVKPTESVDKVKRALANLVFLENIEIEEIFSGFKLVRIKCQVMDCLEPFRRKIKAQQIGPAVRNYSYKHISNGELTLLLHKQAAFADKISLIDSEKESPLGPIKIEARGTPEELEKLIDYLISERD